MRLWDTILSKVVVVLSGHTHCVTCVQWGGEGLLYTSSQDRTIKVWRARDVSGIDSVIIHREILLENYRGSCAELFKGMATGSTQWPSAPTMPFVLGLSIPRTRPSKKLAPGECPVS